MKICRRTLMTLVTLHRPGSANAAASACLYREQERALRCQPLFRPRPEVVSHVVSHAWRLGPVSDRVPPPVAIHICILTGAPRRRRPGCYPPFRVHPSARDVNRLSSSIQWRGHGDSPARRPGTDRPLRFLSRTPSVALPSGCFAKFWACHRRLCRSSAGGDGVLASAGNSVEDRPAIASPFAPLPAIQL